MRGDSYRPVTFVREATRQKGMMLPPGLSFNAIGHRAIEASKRSSLPKSYWRWTEMLENNSRGFFPYTPATNLLYGLREALAMLQEEGLANVFARHARLAEATRCAARQWGLEMVALDPRECSNALTALFMPQGFDEKRFELWYSTNSTCRSGPDSANLPAALSASVTSATSMN
jgi:alanine-glyoxylate transaminase/serine-glyoxylate transaminase/serine-pyruvate transaminase